MPIVDITRPDFNQSLVHLTRERVVFESDSDMLSTVRRVAATPFEVLKEILASGVINGSGNEGFVKGQRKAVCFSEMPLSAVRYFAKPPSEENGRYRFYGISISKKSAFRVGARPVIYLPDAEAEWIPSDEKWRHVRFEHGQVDFTHEREWRIPDQLNLSSLPGIYVFVWDVVEAKEIYDTEFPITNKIRGVLPMHHLLQML